MTMSKQIGQPKPNPGSAPVNTGEDGLTYFALKLTKILAGAESFSQLSWYHSQRVWSPHQFKVFQWDTTKRCHHLLEYFPVIHSNLHVKIGTLGFLAWEHLQKQAIVCKRFGHRKSQSSVRCWLQLRSIHDDID